MKKAIQIISKLFLVVLFLYYHIGNTAFIHTHVIHNQIITHSHPFLPGSHHGHQGGEIETIAWLNAAVEFFTPLAFWACLCLFLRFVFAGVGASLCCISEAACSSRAPPCASLLSLANGSKQQAYAVLPLLIFIQYSK